MRVKAYSLMAAVGLWAGTAGAGSLYWSGDGSSQGGSGTWETNTARWGVSGSGPFGTVWVNTNNDTAIFGSTAGTVTLGTNVQVGGLRFDSSGYTIGGACTLGFGVASGITNGHNSTADAIGNLLTFNGCTLTNVGVVTIGASTRNTGQASRNALVVTNGARLYSGAINVGWDNYGAGGTTEIINSNTLTIVNSFVHANGALTLAYNQSVNGASYNENWNQVIVDGGTLQGLTSISFPGPWGGRCTSYKGNSLIVTNGGSVACSGSLSLDSVGGDATHVSNSVVVANGGALSTVGASIGSSGTAYDYVNVTGGGSGGPTSTWNVGGGTLTFVGNYSSLTIDGAGRAGGAVVTNAGTVSLGGPFNSLTLTNGARWFSTNTVTIGNGANNNTLAIVGGAANSVYAGGGAAVFVGQNATANRLTVGPGGLVTNVSAVYFGYSYSGASSYQNQMNVSGSGAGLFTGGNLFVGVMGGFPAGTSAISNALVIADSGLARVAGGLIVGADGYGNGRIMDFNSVAITNGGRLFTTAVSYIGAGGYASYAGAANSNTVTISGGNALWDVGGQTLYVGYVQSGATAAGNGLTVGSGGILTNAGLVTVGTSANSSTNWVIMTNGTVYSTGLIIGSASSNNSVTVWNGGFWNLLGSNIVVGAGGGTGNSLAVNGGMMTNIPALTVPAGNALSLGVGGQIFANAVTNAGTLAVGIDSAATPDCGRLAVAGNLNITGVPLTLSVRGMGVGIHIIATYGSLTGTFVATNGLPAHGRLEYAYGGGNRIAVLVPAQGTVLTVR